jgi:asparagine N-glycosylation enzyme membrane subunit Stt3
MTITTYKSRRHWAAIRVRRAASWVHLVLAVAVALAVFVQVYLIGAYIFGAGRGALDAHRTVGFTVHGLEVLVLLAALVAWLPGLDLGLSFLLALVGTVQITLASATGWTGGLHPLGALVVLVLASRLVRRGHRRLRGLPGRASAERIVAGS